MPRHALFRPALLGSVSILVGVASAGQASAQTTPTSPVQTSPGATPATSDNAPPSQSDPTQQQPVDQPIQAGAESSDEIVVTGSRIPRAGFDTVQPAVVLGAQQIDKRGYTNIGQALSELPEFGVPGNSSVGAQSNFGAGQTFIDFFSLGSQRTLTLVNGRRFVSSNTASIFGPVSAGSQVDLNTIPTTLVDRVETVAVGGAPIYGSDAIAGTVNIILKRDYQGLQLEGQNGISERGDGAEYRLSGIAGQSFGGDRGNITIAGEYNKTRGIPTSNRQLTGSSGPFFTTAADPDAPYQQQLYYNQRYNVFTNSGVPLLGDTIPEFAPVTDAAGNVLQFGPTGRLTPLDFGTRTGSIIQSSGGNGFPIDDFGNLLTNSERYLGTALANYQITDGIRLFGEGWYSHSSATNLRDQPVYNTNLFDAAGTPDGNIVVDINNPFLNPGDRSIIAANIAAAGGVDVDGDGIADPGKFLLTRANTDLASGRATSTVELYRLVGGADGKFNIGSKTFNWEVSANYGHSTTRSRSRELVQQNFANAIDAVAGPNGPQCRAGVVNATIPTINSTCTPLNLFGVNQFDQAALDYVTAIATPKSSNSQLVLNANIAGPIVTLPGGDVAFSLGYEHRREKTSFDPGDFFFGQQNADGSRTQYGRSIPIDPIGGQFNTDEVFGELRIPLVSPSMGLSFLHELELEGAVRYVDNSLSGGDFTYTAGGRIAPIQDLTLRGNYTRSIRSPAITEAFNPTSRAFDTGQDPCDARYIGSGPNPTNRAANCAAAGITQPFTSDYSDFTVPVTVSGNPNLSNEKANSYTFGAIARPRFLPGFTLAVDYVNISLKNAIVSLGGDNILNACYDSTDYPSSFCSFVTRDSGGQITLIQEGFFNAASLKFAGITTELAYRFGLDKVGLGSNAGTLGLSVNYLYVDKQYSQVGTGDIDTSRGEIGNPKHSFTANVNYDNGGFNLLWQTQYFGKSVIDADGAPDQYQYPGVGDWWLYNASIGYKINDKYEMRFIVDNVFDHSPPFPAPAGGGTTTYYSGLLGRYFRVSAKAKF